MNKRKPHAKLPGYVAERKSNHPKLPGHFVIFDRNNGGEIVTGSDGLRWGLCHMKTETEVGCVVCVSSLRTARALLYDMADGSDICDLGQHIDTN